MAEDFFQQEELSKNSPLNVQRVFSNAVRYWYLLLASLMISLAAAWLINRYDDRIYPVNMSIIIRESEEAGAQAELLYNNPLINPYRNFFNELFIIKSFPLIQNVVEDLDFVFVVKVEGQVKTTERYKDLPIHFEFIEADDLADFGKVYSFKVIGNEGIQLQERNDKIESEISTSVLPFNDTLSLNGLKFMIRKDSKVNLTNFLDEEFLLFTMNPFNIARGYSSNLLAEWAEEGASVVNLSTTGPIIQKQIDFLTRLVELYAEQDLKRKSQAANGSIEFIEGQLQYISDSLKIYEKQLEQFKSINVVTDLGAEAVRLLERIEELATKRSRIIVQESYLKYLQKYLNRPDDDLELVILPSTVGILDPILAQLVEQLLEVQGQARILVQNTESPYRADLLRQINALKNSIRESLNVVQSTNEITYQELDKQIKKLEGQLSFLPGEEMRYLSIKRNYSVSENLYTFLMQKSYEAGITQASATSDIFVVNQAVSGAAISPKIKQNYLIALVIGLGLPLGLLVLLELLNNKIQSKEDISRLTDIPIIGTIGHVESKDAFIVAAKPKSAIAESFRSIRSNLNYFTDKNDHKVFMITSSISGEGKTFTTINLATIIAFSGKKTVIIGADLRRPRIYGDFGLSNEYGLSTYLSGAMGADEIVQDTKVENLFLISAGPVPPNPSELLMKPEMEELLKKLKTEYDYVIIDTPPVGLVTDAFILSAYADHSLFLSRQNYTPKVAITNINELYEQQKIEHLSLVFNDLENLRPGYGYGYGYGYGSGYGYGRKKNGGGYYEE